jgi:hypothetical protein
MGRAARRDLMADLKKGSGPLVLVIASVLAGVAQAVGFEAWVGVGAAGVAVLSGMPLLRRELLVPRRLRTARRATRPLYGVVTVHGSVERRHLGTATQIAAGVWVTPTYILRGVREPPRLSAALRGQERLSLDLVHRGSEDLSLSVFHSEPRWPFTVRPDWNPPEGGDEAVVIGWPGGGHRQGDIQDVWFPLTVRGVFEEVENPNLVAYMGTGVPIGMAGSAMLVGETGRTVAIMAERAEPEGSAFDYTTGLGLRLSTVSPAYRTAQRRLQRTPPSDPTGVHTE